jgi:hypothetical protein
MKDLEAPLVKMQSNNFVAVWMHTPSPTAFIAGTPMTSVANKANFNKTMTKVKSPHGNSSSIRDC